MSIIVGQEINTVDYLSPVDGNTYTVSVDLRNVTNIPEGAELVVEDVAQSEYDNYLNKAAKALNTDADAFTYAKLLDISIVYEGQEIQPNGTVGVEIQLKDGEDISNPQVVHFGQKTEVLDAAKTGNGVAFATTGFSVYAVVDENAGGDEARIALNFHKDAETIVTMYVKNKDVLLGDGTRVENQSYIEDIVYDPGANIPSGYFFLGWTEDENYTKDSERKTIEDIRAEVAELADKDSIREGDSRDYYAAVYKVVNVAYLGDGGVSLGTDSFLRTPNDPTEFAYTVNMAYTADATHNFEGWLVKEGSSNITGYTVGRVYENETEITISGSVIFSVDAPEGQWLVFHENEGTYIAPQFIKSGENTVRPTQAMQRVGYTFDDWYTKDGTTDGDWGEKFTFNTPITDRTHVYAKWNVNATAPYTIIIWKQNLDGEKWDYEESFQLTGNTNTIVNTVTQQGTDQNAYARINNTNYQYTGFHLERFDQTVTIKPDGTAAVNVYYTRNTYTMTFQVPAGNEVTGTGGTQYGVVSGELVRVYHTNLQGGYWYYSSGGRNYRFIGTRFDSNQWTTIKTINALYQQDISNQFPIVGTNGVTYNNGDRWLARNGSTYSHEDVLVSIESMPAESVNFRWSDPENRTLKIMNYYVESLDGEPGDVTYQGMRYNLHKTVNARYWKVTESEDFINIIGFTKQKSNPAFVNGEALNDSSNPIQRQTINMYYTRNKYFINYMDGAYFTGRGILMEDIPNRGHLSNSENIYYDASLADYGSGKSKEYVPTYDNFVFQGWYLDKACTQPYPFETSNMPEGGITVYAKWTQVEYRVFLHPEAGTDPTLEWGSDDQAMNFRRAYLDTISLPFGTRNGYEFVGWFTASGAPYNADTKLTDTNTVAYNKAVDMTDPMDKWGNGATTNADVDRSWITKKLDLYGRWRKTIDGAEGIGIIYDLNGGTGSVSDTTLYKDSASAVAQNAPTTPPANKQFDHWVVQTWNNTTGLYEDTAVVVYPGDNFDVLKSNSKVEVTEWKSKKDNTGTTQAQSPAAVFSGADEINGNGPEGYPYISEATYTVQLKAVYIDAGEHTPTRIDWYENYDDNTKVREDDKLHINQAVDIYPALTRTGYKFLGWARVPTTESQSDPGPAVVIDLGESDVYLKYHEVSGGEAYFTVDDNGTERTVTQVAADEIIPYHDMYAVWEQLPGYLKIVKKMAGPMEYFTIPADGFEITFDLGSVAASDVTVLTQGKTADISPNEEGGVTVTVNLVPTGADEGQEDSIIIQVPNGTTFNNVAESNADPFIFSSDKSSGTVDSDDATSPTTITITNTAPTIDKTGVDLDTSAAKTALLSLFAFAMMCVLGFSVKRRYISRR